MRPISGAAASTVGKEGHRWADCKEPLKESLRLAKERVNCKKQVLNWDGGVGTKGAQPPQMGTAKANTAKANTAKAEN